MPSPQIERKLAAIMFTDIVGYTALSAKDSTKASKLLKTQRDTLKPIVEKHGGSWMKEIGDGLLLTFDSATSAVECSIAIQVATKDIESLNLRIGIHQGEVIKQDGDVIGDDVNVTSRIEPFSAVGGVAISDKIYRDISSNQEFETKYIGKPKLKGVAQKVEVYCITSHGLPQTDISKVSAKLEEESKFNIFALTGGILTAIGVAFWISVGVFGLSFGGKTELPSVAILMMENLGDESDDYFATSLTLDMISTISKIGKINIIPFNNILNLDNNMNINEIAKTLESQYILSHSFLKNQDSIILWWELFDTKLNKTLHSNKITDSSSFITHIVGRITFDIYSSLNIKEKSSLFNPSTKNLKAYELYLKGKYKYYQRKNYLDEVNAITLLEEAYTLDNNILEVNLALGWIFREKRQFDKALKYYEKSKEISQEINNKEILADCLHGIGLIYFDQNKLNKSLEYATKSYEIRAEQGHRLGMGYSLNNIGIVYKALKNYNNAMDYFQRSLSIKEEFGDMQAITVTLSNLGEIFKLKGEYENSLLYFKKCVRIRRNINSNSYLIQALLDLSSNYSILGKTSKSYELSQEALKLAIDLNDNHQIVYAQNILGYSYYINEDYTSSLDYLEKSLALQKEIVEAKSLLWTTTYLHLTYKHLGKDYDEKEIHALIKEEEYIEFELNLRLYELLEDSSYLETAYNQVQEKAGNLEPDVAAKFLSYPIPKAIVEEWEKVTTDKN